MTSRSTGFKPVLLSDESPGLQFVESPVHSILFPHKYTVRSLFYNFPILDHQNAVDFFDR